MYNVSKFQRKRKRIGRLKINISEKLALDDAVMDPEAS